MVRSGERRLYEGMLRLDQEADAKLREVQRYARVSLVLNVQQQGSFDLLSLQRAPDFCRSKEPLPIYLLGLLESSGASRPRLIRAGRTLCRVVTELETPPAAGRIQWERESFNGEGKPLVPVAIFGTDYFHRHGLISAPETYRTDDPVSQEFLKRLAHPQ